MSGFPHAGSHLPLLPHHVITQNREPPTPLVIVVDLPACMQSGSLLSQQLMQYKQQGQGQAQPRSRTPFGSAAPPGVPPEQSPSPAHQQPPDSSYGMGGAPHSSGERWIAGRGGGQPGGLVEDGLSDHGGMGAGGSTWGGSNSTRALRRRGSSGSSEFYFVDTLQQQGGGGGGGYAQPPVRDGDSPDKGTGHFGRARKYVSLAVHSRLF